MTILRRTCCTAFFVAFLQAGGATAQSPTGIVAGTVSLPAGAVVKTATIRVRASGAGSQVTCRLFKANGQEVAAAKLTVNPTASIVTYTGSSAVVNWLKLIASGLCATENVAAARGQRNAAGEQC